MGAQRDRRIWDIRTWPRWVVGLLILAGVGVAGWAATNSDAWLREQRRGPLDVVGFLITAQEQYRHACVIDQDDDGRGEYGWLGEMAGTQIIRSSPRFGAQGKLDMSPFIATSLGQKDAMGRSRWVGHVWHLALPRPDGTWQLEPQKFALAPVAASADLQEQKWLCYAWPSAKPFGDKRTYFIDQTGNIWVTSGETTRYEGDDGPRVSAAFVKDGQGLPTAAQAPSYTGADGNTWTLLDR